MSTDHEAAPVRNDGRVRRLSPRPETRTTARLALVLGLGSLVGALTLASAPAAVVAVVLGLSLAVVLEAAAATVLGDEPHTLRLAVPVRDRRRRWAPTGAFGR